MYPVPFAQAVRHPAHRAPVRAARVRLGVGQRPHDDPALRAAGVPGPAQLLRAAHHLQLLRGAHDAAPLRHRDHRAADAQHAGARQAGGDARSALGRARDPGRGHGRLPRGVRGALPRRARRAARAPSSTRACRRCGCSSPSGGRPSAASAVHFEEVECFPKPAQDPMPIYAGGNHPEVRRRAGQYGAGLDARGAVARGDRARGRGRPPRGRRRRAATAPRSTSRRSSRCRSGAPTTRR